MQVKRRLAYAPLFPTWAENFLIYRKFGLKPRPFRTALSYNGKSDNQAKN
jgi:hypothetical protein